LGNNKQSSWEYVHKIEFYNGTEKMTDLQRVTAKLNSPLPQTGTAHEQDEW